MMGAENSFTLIMRLIKWCNVEKWGIVIVKKAIKLFELFLHCFCSIFQGGPWDIRYLPLDLKRPVPR